MTKEKFGRSKPYVNTDTTGHVDHGETTLTVVIATVLSKRNGDQTMAYDQIDGTPEEREHGITISTARVEYETDICHYAHVDCPEHADHIRNMITDVAQADGATLIASAAGGPTPRTREYILLFRQVGVPCIAIFLNKVDMVDDEELPELVEIEVRDPLTECEFPGDDIPVVTGSALKVLEDDASYGEKTLELVAIVDGYIPIPERDSDKSFMMSVGDVFSIIGCGTVTIGHAERRQVRVSDEVEVVGIAEETPKVTATNVEMFRKLLDYAGAGDNIGALLRGVAREDIQRGQVLTRPGTVTPHTKFSVEVYVLTKEEGGRHTSFFASYRPQFYSHTTDVIGVTKLLEGTEIVIPGDNITMEVELIHPIAIENGTKLSVREDGRIIGVGVVAEVKA